MGKANHSRWSLAVVMALVLALFAAACGESKDDESDGGGGGTAASGKDCGDVTLNEQAWAGSTANTYIAKAVLEDKLGCKVEITKIAEIPVYQALADGGGGGVGVRRIAHAGAVEGQDSTRAREHHARRQPGDHHGSRRGCDRRPGRIGRAG